LELDGHHVLAPAPVLSRQIQSWSIFYSSRTYSSTREASRLLIGNDSSELKDLSSDDADYGIEIVSSLNTPSKTHGNGGVFLFSLAIIAAVALSNPFITNAASLGLNEIAAVPSFLDKFTETGFYQAFSLVFLSEIGDKTFFIAGLLAMKTSRFISFLGSIGALASMTIISVLIGQIFHAVPSGFTQGLPLDDIAAAIAFAFFGLKTLKEAVDMDPGQSTMDEELEEAQEVVEGSSTIKEESIW